MTSELSVPSRIYNYTREPVDHRDHKFTVTKPSTMVSFDLRSTGFMPPVLDQGNLGSCTANATSNALNFCLRKELTKTFSPARLYIYYFSRLLEGNPNVDSGAYIRDVMKAVKSYGACPETMVPYIISKFTVPPNGKCVSEGMKHIPGFAYQAVPQDVSSLVSTLSQGYPIVFGVSVYSSFESKEALSSGDIPLPNTQTETLLGGHCILMIGFNCTNQRFTFQNSWGTGVGKSGFFTIPYQYVVDPNLASDFWTIRFFK